MSTPTAASLRLRAALEQQSAGVDEVLARYGAVNPRLFGSVARGDAREDSDLDLLVDLTPGAGNELLRVSVISEELSTLLLRLSCAGPFRLQRSPTRWPCDSL